MNRPGDRRAARSSGAAGGRRRLFFWGGVGVLAAALLAAGALAVRRRGGSHPLDAGSPRLPPTQTFSVGYNLDYPGDWTNLPPFIDQYKNGRGLLGACSYEGVDLVGCHPTNHLSLDESGWLRSMKFHDDPSRRYLFVDAIVSTTGVKSDIGKRFLVTWEGEGEVGLQGVEARVVAPRRLAFVLEGSYVTVRVTESDPAGTGDYVRNIAVFREDFEDELARGELFNPEMRAYLRPFRSLRFMDWLKTNAPGRCSAGPKAGEECYPVSYDVCGSGVCKVGGRWAERPMMGQSQLLHAGQMLDNAHPELGPRMGGYPLEMIVDLANEMGAHPHLNVAADYDDDYVERFGTLVRDRLSPDLVATIEYSNEVWNWRFSQANYAKAHAEKLWPGAGSGWVQYMAGRTDHMCKILRGVFEGQEHRLRCVISPQTAWPDLALDIFECPLWVADHPGMKNCMAAVDSINIAGYFSGCLHRNLDVLQEWLQQGKEQALDRAFAQLEHGGEIESCSGDSADNLDRTIELYQRFSQYAAHYGVGLTVYEGGTHFEVDHTPSPGRALLVEMTKDPRMFDLYLRNFRGAYEAGASHFNLWGWVAPDDTWANTDTAVDFDHPKYRAAVEFSRRLGAAAAPAKAGARPPNRPSPSDP